METEAVVAATRRWIAGVVVGLDLCPFAGRVFRGDLIRYAVTAAADPEALGAALADELRLLAATPPTQVETAILIHPRALADFLAYNDFMADADDLIRRLGLRGVIQIAGFHPEYRFADAAPDAVENYTNRSPYPMLHLLREDSVTRAAGDDPDQLLDIPRRNVELLRRIGLAGIRAKLDAAGG